jgi:uncharacterized protein YjbI with pentapeptide repeats
MLHGNDLRHILKRVYNHESLAGIDLRNLYLSFMNFSGLDLRRADLEGCCLSHSILDDCDLTDTNLTNAKLNHASFKRAKMTGAILTGVVADGASFEGASGLTASIIDYLKSKGAKGLKRMKSSGTTDAGRLKKDRSIF